MQAIPGPAAEVKRCAKCGEVKPLGEFHRDASNTRDGRQRRCKACQSPNQAAHARHQQAPALLAQGLKACTACGRILPLAGFAPDARKPSGRQSQCRECRQAAGQRRRQADPEAERRQKHERYWANPERMRELARDRYVATREQRLERERSRYRDDPQYREYRKSLAAISRQTARRIVLERYGTVCACCGTADDLSIDHVDGGGKRHRDELAGGRQIASDELYRWLIANDFPEGFQVLCRSCNASKGEGATCSLRHV